MATLYVRNFPDPLYERLREQAKSRNRSLSAEVIILLQRAMENGGEDQGEILARIRHRRSFTPSAVGAPDSLTLLREDRDR